jgi:hypothetical protein
MREMIPETLVRAIVRNLRAGLNTMVWGSPGIGKSDIIMQLGKQLNRSVLDLRANLFDPVDVRGVPHIVKDAAQSVTEWAVPSIFPTEKDGVSGILFIDELPSAPPATQNAFLQLLLTGQLGEYHLPSGWGIVAAGNRISDRAAVFQTPSTVKNRFRHCNLIPNLDNWCKWAMQNGVDDSITSFLRMKPDLLHSFHPDDNAFPTPRTWSFVSKLFALGYTDQNSDINAEDRYYDIAGCIGDGPAGELITFLEHREKMPDIDKLLAEPNSFKIDKNEVSIMYAVCGAIASRATLETCPNICKIADKMDPEFQVILMRDALSKEDQFKFQPDFKNWAAKNATVLL